MSNSVLGFLNQKLLVLKFGNAARWWWWWSIGKVPGYSEKPWLENKTKRKEKKKKKETWTCIGASVNRACESWDKIRVNYFASWSLYCQRIIARTLRVSSLALTLGVSSLAHLGRIIEMRLFFFSAGRLDSAGILPGLLEDAQPGLFRAVIVSLLHCYCLCLSNHVLTALAK